MIPRRTTARSRPHQWWIYERSDRWTRAVRRFAPGVEQGWKCVTHPISSNLSKSIQQSPLDASNRRVILWEIDRENLATVASAIAHIAAGQGNDFRCADLQIGATSCLSPTIEMTLSELGIAAFLRHPEHLSGLENMIRTHLRDD